MLTSLWPKLRSLGRLKGELLDEMLLFVQNRPALTALLNICLLLLVSCKRALRRLLRPRAGDELPAGRAQAGRHVVRSHSFPDRLCVAIVCEESIPQCFRYRVRQKIEQLRLFGYHVSWQSWKDVEKTREAILFAHIIIFYRVPGYAHVLENIHLASDLGKVVLYDLDDLIFDPEIMRSKLDHFGTHLSPEEQKSLVQGADLYLQAMTRCRFGLASTPSLAGQMQAKGLTTYVLPNALDRQVLNYTAEQRLIPQREAVTIFYGSGTRTHDHDFQVVASALKRLMAENTQLKLVIGGYLALPPVLEPFKQRIQRIDFLQPRAYWRILEAVDINIAPLFPDVFSDCKSSIKWLEAAVLGIPSVVSWTASFRETVRDGETGFLAGSEQEWFQKLDALIRDPELRRRIGRQAKDEALEKFVPRAVGGMLNDHIQAAFAALERDGAVSRRRRRRHLLFVNVLYPPRAIGGATSVMANIIDDLRERYGDEFSVSVVTATDDQQAPRVEEYEWSGVPVTRFRARAGLDVDWRYQDREMGRLFERYLRCHQPDVVHFHCIQRLTGSVVQAARRLNIPYLVTLHDAWWLCDRQFMLDDQGRDCGQYRVDPLRCSKCVSDVNGSILRRSYLRRQLLGADAILAVSAYQQDLYAQNGFPVQVNENGLPAAGETRGGSGGSSARETRIRLGYVGGICRHKGYFLFRGAVEDAGLERSEIWAVDFDLPRGRTKTRSWGSTPVHFVSWFQPADMDGFYRGLDVLVAPSLGRESFGLVSREAVQRGVWVVAADAGGLAEPIRHGVNGHVFTPGAGDELTAILKEIDQHGAPGGQGSSSRVHVRTVDQQVDELVAWYRRALQQAEA